MIEYDETALVVPLKADASANQLPGLYIHKNRPTDVLSKPHVFSEKLGKIPPGTRITSFQTDGNFYRIEHDGLTGYVHKDSCLLVGADSLTQRPLDGEAMAEKRRNETGNIQLWLQRARQREQNNDKNGAMEAYRRVLELSPDHEEAAEAYLRLRLDVGDSSKFVGSPELVIQEGVKPGEVKTFTMNSVSFKMVRIPAGEFMMGSPSNESGRFDNETQHRVRISKEFWLGQAEVTQGLWKAVMGSNPSYFSNCGDDCPVESVSWKDCQEFIRKLKSMLPGGNFRLPTEAEWEYACRGGTIGLYAGDFNAMAWHDKTSGGQAQRVGQKKPNPWGLYDMHGNVWEWCEDWKGDYPSGSVTDPTGPYGGSERVRRGGCWGNRARACRSANRGGSTPDFRHGSLGLRLARTD